MNRGEAGVERDKLLRASPQLSWLDPRLLVMVAILTVVGGYLRFSSIAFGLPEDALHLFRPDEEILVLRALRFGPDWNPHLALYPPAQMYVQSGALRAFALVRGKGRDFHSFYARDDSAQAYLIARQVTAVLGTATIVAIYFAAAAVYGPIPALCASGIVAFLTLHVRDSKFAVTDVAAGFWTTLAIAMLLRIGQRGWRRDYLLAGIFSGVATATKYPAGLLAIAVMVTHLEVMRRDQVPLRAVLRDGRVNLWAAASIAAFMASAPYLFLDWPTTRGDIVFQWTQSFPGSAHHFGWSWLLLRAIPDSFGLPLEFLMFAAIALALIRRRSPETVGTAIFVMFELIAIASPHRPFYRYLLIPLPAAAILVGNLASDLEGSFGIRPSYRVATLGSILVGAVMVPFLINDIQLNRLLRRTDTRVLAARWIERNIPAGSKIAVAGIGMPWGKPQFSGMPMPWDTTQRSGRYRAVAMADIGSLRASGVQWVLSDSLPPLADYSPELSDSLLTELGAQARLVLDINPMRPGRPAPIFDSGDAFYAPLVNASSMERPGPRIRVWELK